MMTAKLQELSHRQNNIEDDKPHLATEVYGSVRFSLRNFAD
jgi:hypothetical protein